MERLSELFQSLAGSITGTGAVGTAALLYRDQIGVDRISWLERFSFTSVDLTNGDIIALSTAVLTIFFAAYGNWHRIVGKKK